jgi:hypothetical protein
MTPMVWRIVMSHHPRSNVVIWYEDQFGRKWEHKTRWCYFREDAIQILENNVDIPYDIYYTIENETHLLDYYNSEL